jgi:hypothetical protein
VQQPLCSDTNALTVLSTLCHITPLANRRKFDRSARAKHILFLNFYPPAYRVFFVSACKVGIKRVRIDIMSKNIPVGSALVVGGGIAGMQAALDLADSGYLVHLVNWTRPFRPTTVPCELSRPNWSRSAGISTSI